MESCKDMILKMRKKKSMSVLCLFVINIDRFVKNKYLGRKAPNPAVKALYSKGKDASPFFSHVPIDAFKWTYQ